MGRLENKVAVITGAGAGLGKAITMLYAKEGAKVVIADMNLEAAEETVNNRQWWTSYCGKNKRDCRRRYSKYV